MRLAHLSDTHVADSRRPEDTRRVLEAFVEKARAAEVDLICHTGDWFDAESSESERALVRDFIVAATEIAPLIGIRGNHDHAFDGRLFSDLRTKHPVSLFDRPTTAGDSPFVPLTGLYDREAPRVFGAICIPWFDKSHLAAHLPADVSRDDITRAVNEAAAGLLLGARMEAQRIRAAGAIPILLHHGTVNGARFSSGFVPRGLTVEFTEHQLAEVGCEYVALGHYHASQEWQGGRIAYAGSTERTDFGEPEAKGFRLVTFEGGRFVRNEFVELPARAILLVEIAGYDEGGAKAIQRRGLRDIERSGGCVGALVRFRYRIRPQDLHLVDEDAIRLALHDAGAHEVKVEAVVEHEARVRAAEIVTAVDTRAKVEAYLTAKQIQIDDAQRERLRSKLAEIESPAREEVAA